MTDPRATSRPALCSGIPPTGPDGKMLLKMRLLFLTGTFPFPSSNGLTLRSSSILRALAELGHHIDLVAFGSDFQRHNVEAERTCSSVTILPHAVVNMSAASDYWRRLARLHSATPYGTQRYASPLAKEAVALAVRGGTVDAIVCDTLDCMINIPEPCPAPVILNNHNVEHLILERFLRHERNPARWLYGWLEAKKLRRWESAACRRATLVLACSEFDRQTIEQICPQARVRVAPNVINTTTYLPASPSNDAILLYTGGMDWYPNRDAVEFFAFSILPRIRAQVPHVRFVVAGRNPSPAFLARFTQVPGIEFTGTVPDMRPQIARASVCVVPLRIGSGTRLKILEGGAMAKAMVSTRLGAEGLNFAEGREILLADEPDDFARAVVGLLCDPTRCQTLGMAARKRVEENYSYPVLRESLADAIAVLRPAMLVAPGGR